MCFKVWDPFWCGHSVNVRMIWQTYYLPFLLTAFSMMNSVRNACGNFIAVQNTLVPSFSLYGRRQTQYYQPNNKANRIYLFVLTEKYFYATPSLLLFRLLTKRALLIPLKPHSLWQYLSDLIIKPSVSKYLLVSSLVEAQMLIHCSWTSIKTET
jgi:hypothetical protein